MRSGAPHLIFLTLFVINCLLWSQSRYTQVSTQRSVHLSSFAKRSIGNDGDAIGLQYGNLTLPVGVKEDLCYPSILPLDQQCANVRNECSKPHTVLSLPYAERYFCSDVPLRPALFAAYLVWMFFLFSTLGISASDFFCPNLGTLAQLLGLDENVAGVTFLAFGNGSPDLFSTFSAMREDSGGLAIGELLGAAAFVTSCVVGSMCIIKPFRVDRAPFVRDVGFFTVAVVLLLVVLWDSKIEAWEAEGLIAVYVLYVVVVVAGSWWERRRARRLLREELMRDEYREDGLPDVSLIEPYHDDPNVGSISRSSLSPSLLSPASAQSRTRAISAPGPPPRLELELPVRPQTRSSSPHSQSALSTPHHSQMPSFSLIGALEFRRVVSSLQEQAAGSRLSLFESPLTPYPGGHYHSMRSHRTYSSSMSHSRGRTPLFERERDPWDAALGVPLERRASQILIDGVDPAPEHLDPLVPPIISRTPASPTSSSVADEPEVELFVPPTRRQRLWRTLGQVYHVLFPTLHNFRSKSALGMIAAVFAAPAVMALTLTLPVVVTDHEGIVSPIEKPDNAGRLVDFEEEGVARTLIAEEEVEVEMHDLRYNKWLMAVQCVCGPLFSVAILFDGTKHEPWLLLAAGIAGTTIGILLIVVGGNGEMPSARLARCTMGFMVAIVWIMAIADEVVEVLQTFGLIFGLSDAIIGLTVFAVGNSLADLVANMSVAVFAPIMGFSACFGGPMLNILLGVGISGTYIISQTSEHYLLEFSTTLLITGVGLLSILVTTLIFVPWNDYFLPRSWGVALIIAYACLMIVNVVVEVKTGASF
ncbi:hypothetical protein BDW22DRAFT_1368638 [Trametopsis cervina]|nr:hypothetical protein BDW22DRAFT_1368638 [Trametopsis cervina]